MGIAVDGTVADPAGAEYFGIWEKIAIFLLLHRAGPLMGFSWCSAKGIRN